jgi:hypothetical protein
VLSNRGYSGSIGYSAIALRNLDKPLLLCDTGFGAKCCQVGVKVAL